LPRLISLLSIFILLCTDTLCSQGKCVLYQSIEIEGRLISGDQLGNIYVVVENNIYKYDRNGSLINQYSNNRYGRITSLDATDPYKIVVFYEDFRTVIILDNQLSENGSPIDLQFSDFAQPVMICRAYNTGIWLFDQLMYGIFRVTLSLRTLNRSGNLTQTLGYKIEPNFMKEYNNTLYLNNPSTGILVFDQYGTYVKNISILELEAFQVTEKGIFFLENNKIKKYEFKSLETNEYPLPDTNITGLAVDKNRLFVLTGTSVKIYDYKE